MNLKEAFQAQNKINGLINSINNYLSDTDNIMTVTEKHLRSKALPGQQDESIDASNKAEENFDVTKMLAVWQDLEGERVRLTAAINQAKRNMDFDLDGAVDGNKNRRAFIAVLQEMAVLKSSHVLKKGAGKDYVFNNEGNQTTYCYDIDRIKTIDYDRNKVRTLLKELTRKADEISLQIDAVLLNTQVEYTPTLELIEENSLILEELMSK